MTNDLKDRQISFERIMDAPVKLVFEAWTSSKHLDHWWGPSGFITTTEKMSFEVGGHWKYEMRHEEYGVFPNLIKYLEILENKKIVFDHGTEEGVSPQHRTTVIFEKFEGKTRVCFTLEFPTKEACDKVKGFGVKGGQETLEKLENYVKEIKNEN
jgi:uncharacterized protein YndB with AHSA1/START domain